MDYGHFSAEPRMRNRYMRWEPSCLIEGELGLAPFFNWLRLRSRVDGVTLGQQETRRHSVIWRIDRQDEVKRLTGSLLEGAKEHERYPLVVAWAEVVKLDARNLRTELAARSQSYHAEDWLEARTQAVEAWRAVSKNFPPKLDQITEEVLDLPPGVV